MLVTIIAAAIFLASLLVVAIIIFRKFPTIAAIDVQATTGAIAERKQSLIEQRLRRKVSAAAERVSTVSKPVAGTVSKWWTSAHKKLVDLEHEYKVRSLPVFLSRRQREKIDHEIADILLQAQALADDKEFTAAEDKAMQAVRLEPRSVPAFDFLGGLYLQTKEFGHAKEVYQYLLKLTSEPDAIYEHLSEADVAAGRTATADDPSQRASELNRTVARYHAELALVQLELHDGAGAFASIQEAVRLEPNNPKFLDQYVEISIAAGKKQFAEDAVARIEASNPDNGKIEDWRAKIAAMNDRPLTIHEESGTTVSGNT